MRNERDERKTQGEQEGEGRVCRVIQRRGEELYLAQGKATREAEEEDEGCCCVWQCCFGWVCCCGEIGLRGVTAACVWRKKMGVRVSARVLRWRVMGAATNLEEGDGERWGAVREQRWREGRRIGWRMMGAEMGGDGSGEMMVRSGRGR